MQTSNNLILYFTNNPEYLIGVVFLFGLMFGSFFNVVIYRTPIMLYKDWLANTREFINELYGKLPKELELDPKGFKSGTFNLAVPNSSCPKCNHEIKFYENIPVVSYLFLRGKCSACNTSISIRYPAVELVTGILSAFVAYQLGASLQMLAILVLTWSFICLTMIDYDHHILPDQITLPLLWMGLLLNINSTFVPLESAVIGAAAGYLSLWSIYQVFKLVTGKEGMGFGDFKLLAALGAWMGWEVLPLIILLSSLVGSIIGISFIVIKGRDKNIPFAFGPYLAIAGWITFFWGDAIIDYYKYQIL
ncbi:prepilin peptidase [Gammaproteobacteria bacterium 45_16_T64]|nr:prepilin peptidase [Gammaproteobacteria bacterium 45_16_T64]